MTGREYAAVLRETAEFFDAHPYLPIPDGAPSLVLYYEHPSPAHGNAGVSNSPTRVEAKLS